MNGVTRKRIVFVIYDGICNSVFHGQVLVPILRLLDENKDAEVTLISFEKSKLSEELIQQIIPKHNRFNFIKCYKLPFLGKISLWYCYAQLASILKKVYSDCIVARGPLAGWIVAKFFNKFSNIVSEVIIQARGLAAEEYRFANSIKSCSFMRCTFNKFMYKQYERIEQEVYQKNKLDFTIECVSSALRDYLVKEFDSNSAKIIVSKKDIPQAISKDKVELWRRQMREQLSIPQDAYVYCYNGSAQPWQCIDETINYFTEQLKNNKKSFLLILSQAKEIFKKKLFLLGVCEQNYKVLSVKHNDIYKYLCACDAGMLFRKKDPVNWVSRPTKLLEYQAVGLKIIHNNTIGWLKESAKI